MEDRGLAKPSWEDCVYLLRFPVTTNLDYFLKAKLLNNIFKSLFDLRLHLRPTSTADALSIQNSLEKTGKPPLPSLPFLCCENRVVILDGNYMTQITPKHAAVYTYPFN